MTAHLCRVVVLFLAVLACVFAARPRAGGWRYALLAVSFATIAVGVPFAGWSLPRWSAGIGVSPSVTSTCLLAAFVWRRLGGPALLDERAWRTAWWFGAVAGLSLYPAALGVGPFDVYSWGWGGLPLVVALGLVTFGLLWLGNRFALVLTLGVLAYNLRLLESSNLWDYLTDPLFSVFSLAVATRAALRRLGAGRAVLVPGATAGGPRASGL
jgi:hypothetical protein